MKGILAALLLVGAPAWGQEAPESYPSALVDRPLTLPGGTFSLSVSQQVLWTPKDPSVTPQYGLAANAALGVTRNLEVGANAHTNEGGITNQAGGGAYLAYQISSKVAAAMRIAFFNTSSVDSSSPTLTNSGSGLTTIQSSNSQTVLLEWGAPLKFKLPGMPVAIGGLDSFADLYLPLTTATSTPIFAAYFKFKVPIWIQFSPLRFLSLVAVVTPDIPLGAQPQRLLNVPVEVDVLYTSRRLDAGVAVITTISSDLQAGTATTTMACLGVVTVRL